MLEGVVLRDYVNATVGFERLAAATDMPSKSVMRMLGPKGNPTANNLFAIIGALQRASGVQLQVRIRPSRGLTIPRCTQALGQFHDDSDRHF